MGGDAGLLLPVCGDPNSVTIMSTNLSTIVGSPALSQLAASSTPLARDCVDRGIGAYLPA